MRLKGKVAIVTGAGQGIGRENALSLAREGAKVAVLDVTDKIYDVEREIEDLGGEALALKCDVSNEESVKKAVEKTLERYGKIDVLVNNAGILGAKKPCTEIEEEDWEKTISVNLKGVFLCSKAVLPMMMKQKRGKIINMASIVGETVGGYNVTDYAASKGGVIGFTKALAVEVGKHGISVNAIAPGIIETPMTVRKESDLEKMAKHAEKWIPLRRIGKTEDVANLVVFLSSDDSDYITGQVIILDGGKALRLYRIRGEE